jgi:hypothetical protein
MEAKQPLSDAESAASVAIAVEHGDREALVEALRSANGSQALEEDVIQELADMLMEGE